MDLTALAIRHAVYPAWVTKNHSARLRYLSELEQSQYWPIEELRQHQFTQLKSMVTHAFESCPYYRRKYEAVGFHPRDVRLPEDTRSIPVLLKDEIQEHGSEMVSRDYRDRELIHDMTGGSTGEPMRFSYDTDRRDWREAAALRHDRWTGWNLGDRRALLWGAPRDTALLGTLSSRLREQWIERRLMLDASALDDASMREFAQRLIHYRPRILLAYANTLGLFARFVSAEGIQGIKPAAIITSAEVLTPEIRQLAERTFGCRIYNRYGSREFGVIGSECSEHRGMHVNAENLWVETLAADAAKDPGVSRIIVTDLKNRAMPMIRYQINDVGSLVDAACRCGRSLPLLELSGGRVTDFLTAANGKKVSGIVLATYAITNIAGVGQIQFIQAQPGLVTVKVVQGSQWTSASATELLKRCYEFLGEGMRFELVYVDRIPLEKSGKFRFAQSTL